jgi:hypothetical protein
MSSVVGCVGLGRRAAGRIVGADFVVARLTSVPDWPLSHNVLHPVLYRRSYRIQL